jgi:hypothetical protein
VLCALCGRIGGIVKLCVLCDVWGRVGGIVKGCVMGVVLCWVCEVSVAL